MRRLFLPDDGLFQKARLFCFRALSPICDGRHMFWIPADGHENLRYFAFCTGGILGAWKWVILYGADHHPRFNHLLHA